MLHGLKTNVYQHRPHRIRQMHSSQIYPKDFSHISGVLSWRREGELGVYVIVSFPMTSDDMLAANLAPLIVIVFYGIATFSAETPAVGFKRHEKGSRRQLTTPEI